MNAYAKKAGELTTIGIVFTILSLLWQFFSAEPPTPAPSPDPAPIVIPVPVPDPSDPADAPIITARNSRGERLPSSDLAALLDASKLLPDAYSISTEEVGKRPVVVTVVVGGLSPIPPEPQPPLPPKPDVVPIPSPGVAVLIIEETADRGNLTSEQREILSSVTIREWAAKHCNSTNGVPDFRIYDKDADLAGEPAFWRQAMDMPRSSLPWLIVSDGKQGEKIPLPATVAETMAVLRRYEQ